MEYFIGYLHKSRHCHVVLIRIFFTVPVTNVQKYKSHHTEWQNDLINSFIYSFKKLFSMCNECDAGCSGVLTKVSLELLLRTASKGG